MSLQEDLHSIRSHIIALKRREELILNKIGGNGEKPSQNVPERSTLISSPAKPNEEITGIFSIC